MIGRRDSSPLPPALTTAAEVTVVALIVFQLRLMFSGVFIPGTVAALLLPAGLICLPVRPNPYNENHLTQRVQQVKGA